MTAGPKNIHVGTPDGLIHLLDQNFKSTRSWKAHNVGSITSIKHIPETTYLVTLSEDLSHEPELKVWNLDRSNKKTGYPECLCTLAVQNGRKNFPVTAFTVTNDLTQLATGFGNGSVTVIRGDLIHDRGTRQRTVFESEEPITGLEFREASSTALYIATTARVLSLAITGNRQGTPARTLDENGCAVGCMTLDLSTNEIIIARDDAIYAYGPRGKAASYPYEVSKKLVGVANDYVLIVSPPSNSLSKSALRAFGGGQADDILSASRFTILNTDLKFIAYSESLPAQVSSMFNIWGDIYLVTVCGSVNDCWIVGPAILRSAPRYLCTLFASGIQLASPC